MTTRSVVVEALRSAALQIANDLEQFEAVPKPLVRQAIDQAVQNAETLNEGLSLLRDAWDAGLIA